MNIMIKAFSLTYLLLMVLVTIFGVIWTLMAIFTPKWATKKALLMKKWNSGTFIINRCTWPRDYKSIRVLLALSLLSTSWTANAIDLTFDGILDPGETFRSVPFVEQSGFVFFGSADMIIVDESIRAFLTSDALGLDGGDDPFLTAADGISTFKIRSFSVGALDPGFPTSINLTGSFSDGTSDIFVTQNFAIPGDATGLGTFTPHSLFNQLSFTSVFFDVNTNTTAEVLLMDDVVVETSPPPDLSSTPSFTGQTMTFDNLLAPGETLALVDFVDQNGLLLIGGGPMGILDESQRNFLTSDALGLSIGDDPLLALDNPEDSFKLDSFSIRADTGVGPGTGLCLTASDLTSLTVTQCFQVSDSEFQTLSFADVFDSLDYSSVRFSIQSGDQDDIWFIDDIIVTSTVVPIPPAIWLFFSGLLGLIGVVRKKAA